MSEPQIYTYQVMVIVECAGNGATSQLVPFHIHSYAEDFIKRTDGRSTNVDGQVISCIRCYQQ